MVHHKAVPVSPQAIDDYLERGWFRFGGTMRTTRFTVWRERHLRTTLWTRTRLEGFRWSKSNRRLLRRIRRRFTVREGPARIDAAHEALYSRYIAHVGGERPPTLMDFLGGPDLHARFATRSITIHDGERLVAFSYFDPGHTSLMSLLGAYDPAYARESLGYGTLVLEVEHARRSGMAFHYSGYVLPGEPSMDYKLRIGGIEFLHPDTGEWLDWSALPTVVLPDRRTLDALEELAHALGAHGIPSRTLLNPLFEIADSPAITERMVDQPVFLVAGEGFPPFPIVTWNDLARRYDLWSGISAIIRHRRSEDSPERSTATALIHHEHGSFTHADATVAALIPLLR